MRWSWLTIRHHLRHAQTCLTDPVKMTELISCYYGCLMTWKIIPIPQIVCEILQFKESCILVGLEVFGSQFKNLIFPRQCLQKIRRLLLSNFMQKIRKKLMSNVWDFALLTDYWMDRPMTRWTNTTKIRKLPHSWLSNENCSVWFQL